MLIGAPLSLAKITKMKSKKILPTIQTKIVPVNKTTETVVNQMGRVCKRVAAIFTKRQIAISDRDLDELLAEKLFAQVRKSLQNDFDLLVSRNLLQRVTDAGRSKNYRRVETIPVNL